MDDAEKRCYPAAEVYTAALARRWEERRCPVPSVQDWVPDCIVTEGLGSIINNRLPTIIVASLMKAGKPFLGLLWFYLMGCSMALMGMARKAQLR